MSEQLASKCHITAEDLKEFLECPVCLRIPRSAPVYQCERGHVVCNECHPKLATCPVCRLPLGKTRSLISEKVLAKMPSACKFVDYGCVIELMKDALNIHETECPYRMVHCVDLACQQMVPFMKLMDHMKNDHEREDFVNADGASYVSHFIVHEEDFAREIMWISDHLQLDGKHFFRECCRNSNGLWYVWVYLMGAKTEAKDYTYEIKISSDDQEEELSYKGQVVSLDIPKEDLAISGSVLIFPDSTARRFWTEQRINYTVSVRSKKQAKENSGTSSKKKVEDTNQTKSDSSKQPNSNNNCSSNQKKKPEKNLKKEKSDKLVNPTTDGAAKPESGPEAEDVKETPC